MVDRFAAQFAQNKLLFWCTCFVFHLLLADFVFSEASMNFLENLFSSELLVFVSSVTGQMLSSVITPNLCCKVTSLAVGSADSATCGPKILEGTVAVFVW